MIEHIIFLYKDLTHYRLAPVCFALHRAFQMSEGILYFLIYILNFQIDRKYKSYRGRIWGMGVKNIGFFFIQGLADHEGKPI